MIPNMNSTEEALAFGEKANEEQVKMMKRIYEVCQFQFYNLFETDDSDEAFSMMGEISTQGQLMREAVEASAFSN